MCVFVGGDALCQLYSFEDLSYVSSTPLILSFLTNGILDAVVDVDFVFGNSVPKES